MEHIKPLIMNMVHYLTLCKSVILQLLCIVLVFSYHKNEIISKFVSLYRKHNYIEIHASNLAETKQKFTKFIYTYSKIPLSQIWFILNTPLISKSIAGPVRFPYLNDLKNSWYLEHGYLEYPAYLEVYLWSQTRILPRLFRSAVNFPVCLTYLASLHHQFTPPAIYTHYNLCYPTCSLIVRCPRSVN
jgi:hypothetical protein